MKVFKTGATVALKTGVTEMVVSEYPYIENGVPNPDFVKCVWEEPKGVLHTEVFHKDILDIVPDTLYDLPR